MNRRFRLIASLCLNVLLAGIILRTVTARRPGGPALASESITNRVVRVRHTTNTTAPERIEVAASFNWRELESADYRVYMENLRAIGCPEATIEDIIVADVEELFARRVSALVDEVSPRFWELIAHQKDMEELIKVKVEQFEDLRKEQQDMLKALFNGEDPMAAREDAEHRAEVRDNVKSEFEYLSDEKIAALNAIREHTQQARSELAADPTVKDRREKLRQLSAEEDGRIRALLTPEEFDEYQLRSRGSGVRYGLADFNGTEDEFRAIARATMNTNGTDQVRQLLGPDRFAEYQRASDETYRQTLQITDRFGLPPQMAVEVYRMQKEAEAEARKIRGDAARAPEERQAILLAMRAETEKSISGVLGLQVFKAYQKHHGDWLSRFAEDAK